MLLLIVDAIRHWSFALRFSSIAITQAYAKEAQTHKKQIYKH